MVQTFELGIAYSEVLCVPLELLWGPLALILGAFNSFAAVELLT